MEQGRNVSFVFHLRAGRDNVRTLCQSGTLPGPDVTGGIAEDFEAAKKSIERWFDRISDLVAQKDEELFKIVELIEEIEERITPPREDLAA